MKPFQIFSIDHLIPLLIAGALLVALILLSKKYTFEKKKKTAFILAILTMLGQLAGPVIKVMENNFTLQEDLPLYLCRLLAYILPLAIYFNNKKWLNICYFWVLAGTLQACITPDIELTFPNHMYIIFWILHLGLLCTTLYYTLTYPIKISWRDFWNAILWTQVFVLVVHVSNIILNSNYSYTMRKPPGPTLLDVMGPWPVYLITGQGVMVISFLMLMIPYILKRKK